MARHTGVGLKQCPYCSYSTANRSNYKNHVRIHTGEDWLHCSLCSYSNLNRRVLLNHMIRMHGGSNTSGFGLTCASSVS